MRSSALRLSPLFAAILALCGAARLPSVPAAQDRARAPLEEARSLLATARESVTKRALAEAGATASRAIDLAIGESGATPAPELEALLLDLGRVAQESGALPAARKARFAVVESREKRLAEDDVDLLRARRSLAVTLATLGEHELARDLFEKVLHSIERTHPQEDLELQMARDNLATVRRNLGDVRGALELQTKVVAGLEKLLPSSDSELQRAWTNLGGTLHAMGDDRGARRLYARVVAEREKTLDDDAPDLLRARDNLAIVLRELGDLQAARILQEKVVASLARHVPEGNPDLIEAQGNLAGTLESLGDLHGARALYERALAVLERQSPETSPDVLGTQANLARTLAALGDSAAARDLREKVVARLAAARPEDDLFLLSTQLDSSLDRADSGDAAGARARIEKVLGILERRLPEDHLLVQSARADLAEVLASLGEVETARALLEKVVAVRSVALPADHPELLSARNRLAWTLFALRDEEHLPAVLADVSKGIVATLRASALESPHERALRLARLEASVSVLLSCARSPSAPTFALLETLRARSADSGMREEDLRDPEVASLRAKAKELRARIHDLAGSVSGDRADAEALRSLVGERDRVEREVEKRLAALGRREPDVETALLASRLPKSGCAVAYRRYTRGSSSPGASKGLRFEDSILAHVLRPDGSLVRVEIGSVKEVAAAVEAWRAAVGKPIERGVSSARDGDRERDAGEALRRLVLDPVLAAASGADRLFVCGDDAILLVPLDALPLEKGLIGDKRSIIQEASFARLLEPARAIATSSSLLALGGIDYNAPHEEPATSGTGVPVVAVARRAESSANPLGSNWGPLAETRAEVADLCALFRSTFEKDPVELTGKDATKAAFESGVPGARFLHVATHGYFASESVRGLADSGPHDGRWAPRSLEASIAGLAPSTLCGLALAGANRGVDSLGHLSGVETAEELAGLDLASCELAVLSACETNVGVARAGQGVRSLQAALHAAGARTAITSLWKVDDALTRELFEDFYTRIWVKKEPKALALWAAKSALRKQGAPTREWAAWVLSGDPN